MMIQNAATNGAVISRGKNLSHTEIEKGLMWHFCKSKMYKVENYLE